MKIRKLEIQNYKIFDDVSFDFTDENGETLSTVVLAGMNGCGKTTVLEVICDFFTGNILPFENDYKIKILVELTENEQVNWPKVPFELINYPDQTLSVKAKIRKSRLVEISDNGEFQYFSNLICRRYEPYHSFPGDNFVYFPVKPTTTAANYQTKSQYSTILSMDHLIGRMKKVALKTLTDEIIQNRDITPRQSIEKRIADITRSLQSLDLNTRLIDLTSEELIFESANGKLIYFEQLSHGEQHLYFRAIYLSQLNLKDAVILIDEPEAAFHPTWQQKIAGLYNNVGENNQVFMATHSPHIMASVPPESLFVLNVDEETKKITAINMGKAGKHSQGLEPNRILKEVMQVDTLREYQTQVDIDRLTALLTLETFEGEEAQNLIEKLTDQLGQQDPFIIRLEHQLLVLNRKKQKPVTAE